MTIARNLAEASFDMVVADSESDEYLSGYYNSLLRSSRTAFARRHNIDRWTWAYGFILSRQPPIRTILDFGCGVGTQSLALAQAGITVTGVDLSPEAISTARKRAERRIQEGSIQIAPAFICESGVEMTKRSATKYDAVLFHESLAHVGERPNLWAPLRQVLAPGGVLVIAEANGWNPAVVVNNAGKARRGQKGVDDPRYVHKKLSSVHALKKELAGNGFDVEMVRFFGMVPPAVWRQAPEFSELAEGALSSVPMLNRIAVSYTLRARRR